MCWTPIIIFTALCWGCLCGCATPLSVPGAAKNLPYDHLLLGTSVTANFHTDQFDEALGGRTQKIIIHGAYFEELLRPLDIALETHDLDQIFWGVDSDCWRKYDADNTWEDASYLFDNNPFNDLHYLLNKEMVFYTLTEMVDDLRAGGTDDEHTGGYIWGDDKEWSKEGRAGHLPASGEKAAQQVRRTVSWPRRKKIFPCLGPCRC